MEQVRRITRTERRRPHARAGCGNLTAMPMQWRTRYPLPPWTVRLLRWGRWMFLAFGMLEPAVFIMTLTEEHPSTWTLIRTGWGTVFFPFMFLLAQHLLRKNDRIIKGTSSTG